MEMSVPISTPYSADSEGSVLREFMDAQEQNHTEQNHTSHATRLSQDVPARENGTVHYGSIAQRPEGGQTQTLGEPTMGELGSIPRISTSAVPFPTLSIDPAPEGLIQEPGVGAQGQQDQPARYSHVSQPSRETVQDPGPSNQYSRESQRRQSRHAPNTALEPGQPTTDAQEPHRSLYSGNSEGQILRDFVNTPEQLPPESRVHNPHEGRASGSIREEAHPRSSRAFQKSRAVNGTAVDPGSSKRRSHHRSRSHHEITISDATTMKEAIRQLMEQRKETNTLRRALRLAVEQVDTENQRALALERNNARTIEQFSTLNESRLAAQQEALKAGSELRLYQFQLENAHKEIARAQEMLRTVENQRDEADEAASRARARARKYAQEHMVTLAKEEGRRLGFEAGLRRAQEEAAYLNLGSRRVPNSRVRSESVSQVTAIPADFDLEYAISSPVRQRTSRTRQQNVPREPSTPPQPQVQSPTPPESEASVEEGLQAPHAPEPALDITRAASPGPSVVRYAVSIPPASEIEQQNSQTQYPGESSPWVTARQYHQITGTQPSPENLFQANFPEGSRNVVTFAPAPPQGNPDKKKSWLHRTLTRPWRRASRAVPDPSLSWYLSTSSANPPPTVHVRDFGAGAPEFPRTSTDDASVSTSLSQLGIVSPPPDSPGPSNRNSNRNPNRSEHGLAGSGPKGRRRSPLHVINEDLVDLNETLPPLRRDIPPVSPSMGQIRELLGDTRSNYSDPKALEKWRRSSASVSVATETNQSRRTEKSPNVTSRQTGPPPRRPVHLTIPAPLAPQAANPPSSSTMPGSSSQNPALLDVNGVRPPLQRNPTSGTVYGITVEPPSRSPTEAPNSARQPHENLLSPNETYAHSLRSMAPYQNVGPSSARGSTTPLIFNRSRPGSVARHSQAPPLPSKSPMTMASSRSLPQTDRPPSQYQRPVDDLHRGSVASHATTNVTRPMADNASIRSGPRSVNAGRNTPQQGYPNQAPVNPNPSLHRRTVSDSTYLTPNGLSGTANGVHGLYRLASNQSMSSVRSANSQYSHFDPSTYVEPTALYEPVSVGPSRQGERQTTSNASGTTLSYISRT